MISCLWFSFFFLWKNIKKHKNKKTWNGNLLSLFVQTYTEWPICYLHITIHPSNLSAIDHTTFRTYINIIQATGCRLKWNIQRMSEICNNGNCVTKQSWKCHITIIHISISLFLVYTSEWIHIIYLYALCQPANQSARTKTEGWMWGVGEWNYNQYHLFSQQS